MELGEPYDPQTIIIFYYLFIFSSLCSICFCGIFITYILAFLSLSSISLIILSLSLPIQVVFFALCLSEEENNLISIILSILESTELLFWFEFLWKKSYVRV